MIEFGGGVIDCSVRNVSNAGAAPEVTSPIGIPDRFTLVLPGEGLHMPHHVVWRDGGDSVWRWIRRRPQTKRLPDE
jgi:hypothetical protein